MWNEIRRRGPGQGLPLLGSPGTSLASCLSFLLPGEQDCTAPEQTDCTPSPLAWGTHMHSVRDWPVAATIRSQSLVSIGLPGGCDKLQSPQRWQPELFLEQHVVGEFPLGSGWGWVSWAGEVPYRAGLAPLPTPALAPRGHPDLQSPGTECSPSTLSQTDLPRASSQGPLCKVPGFVLPPAVGNPSPFPSPWRVCPASDQEASPRDLRHLGSEAPELGCTSVTTAT